MMTHAELVQARRVVAMVVRYLVCAAALIFVWMDRASPALAAAIVIFTLSISFSRIVSCLNFICFYWFATFIIAAPLNVPPAMVEPLQWHYAGIQALITIAYNFRPSPKLPRSQPLQIPAALAANRLAVFWWSVVAITAILLVATIVRTGIGPWFTGKALADQIGSYAARDIFETITRATREIVAWSLVAMFAIHRLHGVRLSRAAIMTGFLGLPLLAMSRVYFVYNSLFLVMTSRRAIRAGTAVLGLILIGGVGLTIGFARAQQLGYSGNDAVVMLLSGEFSSSIAYADLLKDGHMIGQQWGKNIVGSVVTWPIPRSIWENKPQNGAGLYMLEFYPQQFAAGYSLAINSISDAWIAFGTAGVVVWSLFLGWAYRGVDARLAARTPTLWDLLLVFNIYQTMRATIAHAIIGVVVQAVIYILLRNLLSGGRRQSATYPDQPYVTPEPTPVGQVG